VASYKDEAKQLIINIKYGSSRPTSTFVGRLLANKLPYLPGEDVIVTHIPTTPARIRERSFDQSQRIAKAMSASVHLTYARLLYRKTKSHQVGFTRAQRQEHMKQAFGVLHASLIKGKTVLLVDDVLTTGSTLESAAKELKNAGAKRVIGAVFARTE
jgi:ComF family protein